MQWIFNELKDRFDPKVKQDEKLVRQLCKRLKKLGYHFHSKRQFNFDTFQKKDSQVIPVIIDCIDKFENDGYKIKFISALCVEGFCDATEYLIGLYQKNLPPSYNWRMLNALSRALAQIGDLNHLEDYFAVLSNSVTFDAAFLVEMLGRKKVRDAVPYLVKLLDCEAIIPSDWEGDVLEDHKYLVSQKAIEALGKIGLSENVKYIEKFLKPEKLDFIHYTVPNLRDQKSMLNSTYKEYKEITQKAISIMKI